MMTVIVRFPAPAGATTEKMADAFNSTAPLYEGVPGLVRKYYLFDPESMTAGGVYLWDNAEKARNFYNDEWRQRINTNYDAEPDVTFYQSPVIVDNSL